ncbi:MAG TPA: peptidoglycan-binding protein [Candidatus Omnitrophota bacterium]|nr:peptidoglycan-binding protein [Candidatus Omnitrophota bacterium]HPN88591.1 peptidoglycan-binding protein [Candidatus Omnitrophota bacterium]
MAKQQKNLLFILMLCFILGGCDYLYSLLHKEGAQEKKLVGEVVPYKENENVEQIQSLLKIYGYNPGKIDGVLGFRTRDAIKRFQEEQGLNPSRFVDEDTWNYLKVFKDNKFIIDDKLNVSLVQQALEKAGFRPGKIDGEWGKKTENAVKEFQKAHRLKVDGRVGYQTLLKLSEFVVIENKEVLKK